MAGHRRRGLAVAIAAVLMPLWAHASWVTGQVQIVGSALTAEPAFQVVPLNVPTVVQLSSNGSPLPEGAVLKGLLEGPAYPGGLALESEGSRLLQIPGLPVSGSYVVRNLRLERAGVVLATAVPSQVQVDVRNVLVTSVLARPATWEEIQQSGILLNANDYKVFRYSIGLGLESRVVPLDYTVAFSAAYPERPPIVLEKLGLPGLPPLPHAGTSGPPSLDDLADIGNLDIEPVQLTLMDGDSSLDELEIPGLQLSGVLVFPGRVACLDQFFLVALLLQNGAPAGSPLVLENVRASVHFADGSGFELRDTKPPLSGGTVPVVNVGADGILGTADDQPVLAATLQGQSEFTVRTPNGGTYPVEISFDGDLYGLPTGRPVRVMGKAAGTVAVRPPELRPTFVHPAVVREREDYDLKVTVANTSSVPAYDVSLGFSENSIEGAVLRSGQPNPVSLGNLEPGQSATATFRLMALRTGRVTVSSSSGGASLSLSLGVGAGGILLSPDTLLLPPVVSAQLPEEVVESALDLLGLGWSLATAPPEARPSSLAPVPEGVVRFRSQELIEEARALWIAGGNGWTLPDAASALAVRWMGAGLKDRGWDLLRRQGGDSGSPSKGEGMASALGLRLAAPGEGPLDAHERFARTSLLFGTVLSAAVDPEGTSTAPRIWWEDEEGRRTGWLEAGLGREIPWSEALPLAGEGRLAAVAADADASSFTLHLQGTAEGTVALSVALPLPEGLGLATFENLTLGPRSEGRLVFHPGSSAVLLELDAQGSGSYSVVPPTSSTVLALPSLRPLGAVQDLTSDQAGRAVAVLFNRPLSKENAEDLANYSLNTRVLRGAFLQRDGRTVLLSAQSKLSPLVENTLTITGLRSAEGSPLAPDPAVLTVVPSLTAPGGTVQGVVYGEDGNPLPGVRVYLWEYDEDFLRQQEDALEQADPVHVTQETVTDAAGHYFFDYVAVVHHAFAVEALDPASGRGSKVWATMAAPQNLHLNLYMRARGVLAGTVFGSDGHAAVGVLVTATEVSSGEFGQAVSDGAGRYRIERLPVGTLQVQAVAPGGLLHAEGTSRIAGAGQVARLDLQLSERPLSGLRVVVVDEAGRPLEGALAALGDPWNGGELTSVLTRADGLALLAGVPPGAYALDLSAPGAEAAGLRLNLVLVGGELLDLGTVVLRGAPRGQGSVTGTFYGADRVTPLPHAPVFVAGKQGILAQTTTDAQGAFSLSGIPLGTWTLSGHDPVSGRTAARNVYLSFDGEVFGTNLYLPQLGRITGTVRSCTSGGPVEGARVVLDGRETRSDAQGRFEFSGVGVGPEHRLAALLGEPPFDMAKMTVPLLGEGETVDVTLTLSGRGDLKVHTETPAGASVAAQVSIVTWEIDSGDLSFRQTVLTRSSDTDTGIVEFPSLLAKDVIIFATSGFGGTGTGNAIVRCGSLVEVEVVLKGSGSVEGEVVDTDGVTPRPDALVTLTTQGMPPRRLPTRSDGTFSFSPVPLGGCTVEVRDPVSGRRGTATGILSSSATPLHLRVILLGEGDVRGTVYEEQSNGELAPAPHVRVSLEKGAPLPLAFSAETDILGQFVIHGVEEGAYALLATDDTKPFPLAERASLTVERGRWAEATLVLSQFGAVRGRILGPGGTDPVPGLQAVLSLGKDQPQAFCVTDEEGRFDFSYVPLNRSFTVQAFDPRSGRLAAGTGRLSVPHEVLNLDLSLASIGTIEGHVFEQDGATPVAAAALKTWVAGQGAVEATAGADGAYSFPGLPAGTYRVEALHPRTGNRGEAGGTLEGEGQFLTLDIAMAPSGTIAGNVVRADGSTPVPSAIVTLGGGRQAVAGPDGLFRFENVPLGPHEVSASDPLSRDGGRSSVLLTSPGQLAEVQVRFVGLGTVRGTVRTPGGDPVPGFEVYLTESNPYEGSTRGPAGTDGAGHFEFRGVRCGSIAVTAGGAPGSGDTRRGSASGLLASEGGSLDLDVVLGAAGSVTGTILRESSVPAVGAVVELTRIENGEVRRSLSGAGGSFLIPAVPVGSDGRFRLLVTGPEGGHARAVGELVSDGQVWNAGTLVLDETPPSVVGSEPAEGAVNVALGVSPAVAFSEELDPATLPGAIRLLALPGGTPVPGTASLDADGRTVRFTPQEALLPEADYLLEISSALQDIAGNPAPEVQRHFRTLDNVPPAVVGLYPAAGAVQVPVEAQPFLLFGEAIAPDSLAAGTFRIQVGGAPVPGTVSLPEPNKILFTPQQGVLLSTDTIYSLEASGFTDLAGNPMVPWSSSFATLDTLPPVASVVVPSDLEAGRANVLRLLGSDGAGLATLHLGVSGALTAESQENYPPLTAEAEVTATLLPSWDIPDGAEVQVSGTAEDRVGHASTPATASARVVHLPAVSVVAPGAGASFGRGGRAGMAVDVQPFPGTAEVSFLVDGQVRAVKSVPPYEAEVLLPEQGDHAVLSALVTTGAGKTVTAEPVTVALLPSASLHGAVWEPDGQTPVPGARVVARSISTPPRSFEATTGPDGAFDFGRLPLSRYVLEARRADGTDGASSLAYLATEGAPVARDLVLAGTGTLTGRLVDSASNEALPGAAIHFEGRSVLPQTFDLLTDGQGRFQLDHVLTGAFQLRAIHPASGQLGAQVEDRLSFPGEVKTFERWLCYADAVFVTSFEPADGEGEVSPGTAVRITFSQPVDASTLRSGIGFWKRNLPFPSEKYWIDEAWSLSADGTVATLSNPPLAIATEYGLQVSNVRGVSGRWVLPASAAFTTRTPPLPVRLEAVDRTTGQTLVGVDLPADLHGLPAQGALRLVFGEPLAPQTVAQDSLVLFLEPGEVVTGTTTLEASGEALLWTPAGPLPENSRFRLFVSAGLGGNDGDLWSYNFQAATVYSEDTEPPRVAILSPPSPSVVLGGADLLLYRDVSDGDNYCAPSTAVLSVGGEVRETWNETSCTPSYSALALPEGGGPLAITLTAQDASGRAASATAEVVPLEPLFGPGLTLSFSPGKMAAFASTVYLSRDATLYPFSLDPGGTSPPAPLPSVACPAPVDRMAAEGGLLLVACHDGTLQAYDLSDPSQPALRGQTLLEGWSAGTRATGLVLTGPNAYVGDSQGVLRVVSLRNAASPVQVAALALPGPIAELQGDNGLLAVLFDSDSGTTYYGTLRLYTLPPDGIPRFAYQDFNRFGSYRSIDDFALEGEHLWLNTHGTGVRDDDLALVDVAIPDRPTLLGASISSAPGLAAFFCEGPLLLYGRYALGAVGKTPGGQPYDAGYRLDAYAGGLLARAGEHAAIVNFSNGSVTLATLRLAGPRGGGTLSITSPPSGGTVAGGTAVPVVVSAPGYSGVVTLEADGRPVAYRDHAPYTFLWAVPCTGAASVGLTASLRDDGGNRVVSEPVSLTISPCDLEPPTLLSTDPSDGQTAVPSSASLVADWSEPLDPAWVNGSTVTLQTTEGTPIYGSIILEEGGTRIRFSPSSLLLPGTSYLWTLDRNIRDLAGNPAGVARAVAFTTAVQNPPAVDLWIPGRTLVGGDTILNYTLRHERPITTLELLVQGLPVPFETVGEGSLRLPPLGRAFGEAVELRLRATDDAGLQGTSAPVAATNLFDETGQTLWSAECPWADNPQAEWNLAATRERIAVAGPHTLLFDAESPSLPLVDSPWATSRIAAEGTLAVAVSEESAHPYLPAPAGHPGGIAFFRGEDVALEGALAAVAVDGSVRLYDLACPQEPVLLATLAEAGRNAHRVWLRGGLLVVYSERTADPVGHDLWAYDIHNPEAPLALSAADAGAPVLSGVLLGRDLAASYGNFTVLYNLSDPANLAPEAGGGWLPYGPLLSALGDRFLLGQVLYDESGCTAVEDLLDPQVPQRLYFPIAGGDLDLCGPVAAAAAGTSLYRLTREPGDGAPLLALRRTDLLAASPTPSSVALLEPSENETVNPASGFFKVRLDPMGVPGTASVRILVNGVEAAERSGACSEFLIPVRSEWLGQDAVLEARLADLAAREVSSGARHVHFGTEGQGIRLIPAGPLEVPAGGFLDVEARVLLAGGVTEVSFTVNGQTVRTDTAPPFTCRIHVPGDAAGQSLAVDALASGPQGSLSTAGTGTLVLNVTAPTMNRVLGCAPLPSRIWGLQLSADATKALALGPCGLEILDAADWKTVLTQSPLVQSAVLHPDGETVLLTEAAWPPERLVKTTINDLGEATAVLPLEQPIQWPWALAPDGSRLVLTDQGGTLHLVNVETLQDEACCSLTEPPLSLVHPSVDAMAFVGGGQTLEVAVTFEAPEGTRTAVLRLNLDTRQWEPAWTLPEAGQTSLSPRDGSLLFFGWDSYAFYKGDWDGRSLEPIPDLPEPDPLAAIFHPEGGWALVLGGSGGGVYAVDTGSPPSVVAGSYVPVPSSEGIAFDATGRYAYVVGEAICPLWQSAADVWAPRFLGLSGPKCGGSLRAFLSEPMDTALVGEGTVTITDAQGGLVAGGSLSTEKRGTVLVWSPPPGLAAGAYTLHLVGLRDEAGNELPPVAASFEGPPCP